MDRWARHPLSAPYFEESVLANRYFAALATLSAPTDPAAPSLFASEAWRWKQTNTALGAWAQSRATWSLQTREVVSAPGMLELPPGFIEPVPEFFQRFAVCVEATRDALEQHGALAPEPLESAFVYLELTERIAQLELDREPAKSMGGLYEAADDDDAHLRVDGFLRRLSAIPDADQMFELLHRTDSVAQWVAARKRFAETANRLLAGQSSADVLVRHDRTYHSVAHREAWNLLASLCHRLEALSQKQLRGAVWSEDDAEFIRHFGEQLSSVMLYTDVSFLIPPDTAPRVATVASNPRVDRVLHVGIGRPRELLLLYPWKGAPVLCRGAIVPYYEHGSSKRLDDSEWRELLDSAAAPPLPAWAGQVFQVKPAPGGPDAAEDSGNPPQT